VFPSITKNVEIALKCTFLGADYLHKLRGEHSA